MIIIRLFRTLLAFVLRRLLLPVVFLYLLIGAVVPSAWHKTVDDSYAAAVSAADFYADELSSERIACIGDNQEAWLKRLQLIDTATDSIIYSTFNFYDDNSGNDVMAALYAAAERGISVKMIVDSLGSFSLLRSSAEFQALAAHPNVEIKEYNPPDLLQPWAVQMRLHEKYLIIDDYMYLLGGRNTGDAYIGDYEGRHNVDCELLVYQTDLEQDNTLRQLLAYFDTMWEQDCCRLLKGRENESAVNNLHRRYSNLHELYPSQLNALSRQELLADTIAVNKITLLSNPVSAQSKKPQLWYALNQLMLSGREIIITTPYVIFSDSMYEDFRQLCQTAQEVSIITNAVETGANVFGSAHYLEHKQHILDCGTDIYEYAGENSSHMKSILVDDRISVVGSFNFDMRSCYLDSELMLVVDSVELNKQLRGTAEEMMSLSRLVRCDGEQAGLAEPGEDYEEPCYPWGKRFLYALLSKIIIPLRHLL